MCASNIVDRKKENRKILTILILKLCANVFICIKLGIRLYLYTNITVIM